MMLQFSSVMLPTPSVSVPNRLQEATNNLYWLNVT